MSVDLVRSCSSPQASRRRACMTTSRSRNSTAGRLIPESVRGRGTALVSWRVPNAMGERAWRDRGGILAAERLSRRRARRWCRRCGLRFAPASLPGITTTVFDMGYEALPAGKFSPAGAGGSPGRPGRRHVAGCATRGRGRAHLRPRRAGFHLARCGRRRSSTAGCERTRERAGGRLRMPRRVASAAWHRAPPTPTTPLGCWSPAEVRATWACPRWLTGPRHARARGAGCGRVWRVAD